MILQILTYPDPVLKKRCVPVSKITGEIRRLIDDMFDTMYDAPGVGLSACQVGVDMRVIVVDVGESSGDLRTSNPYAVVNPEIVSFEGEFILGEGCLSCPELSVEIKRYDKIKVEGLDRAGKSISISAEGLLSAAFQHEIDHINGILIADRLSTLKRDIYKKKLIKNKGRGQISFL